MFYLASQSPRRRALLASVGLEFATLAPRVDERVAAAESAPDAVLRLAADKARAGDLLRQAQARPAHPVLAADTMVVIEGEVLGKPRDAAQAAAMLARLSGRTHRVLTAVVLRDGESARHCCCESLVTMKALCRREIERYWASGEPADKAGAYAIQGLGSAFVARLEGSYSSVVGLPLFETRQLLIEAGIDWL